MWTVILFVAGAMSLSTAFGNDPGFEERLKMKTGRYTPAGEARREKASIAAKTGEGKTGHELRPARVLHSHWAGGRKIRDYSGRSRRRSAFPNEVWAELSR